MNRRYDERKFRRSEDTTRQQERGHRPQESVRDFYPGNYGLWHEYGGYGGGSSWPPGRPGQSEYGQGQGRYGQSPYGQGRYGQEPWREGWYGRGPFRQGPHGRQGAYGPARYGGPDYYDDDRDYYGQGYYGYYGQQRSYGPYGQDPYGPRQYGGPGYGRDLYGPRQYARPGYGQSPSPPGHPGGSRYAQAHNEGNLDEQYGDYYGRGRGEEWRSPGGVRDYKGTGDHGRGDYSGASGGPGAPNLRGDAARWGRTYRRGPKGYQRSDERLREDISERLMQAEHIDSSDVTVTVEGGKVILEGTVPERYMKHAIEDLADACPGVQDIENRIRVVRAEPGEKAGEPGESRGMPGGQQAGGEGSDGPQGGNAAGTT